jgi:hypothetical protein
MSSSLIAQEMKRPETDIAKQLQNPLANFNLLGLSSPSGFGWNDRYGNPSALSVRRMVPFSGNVSSSGVAPTLAPTYSSRELAHSYGVRDLSVSALVAPADAPTITWGLGPALSFPGTNSFASNSGKWGTGASGAVVYSVKAWVGGVFISNMWSFEGNANDDQAINQMVVQPFLNYNLSKGWYLTSAPAISVNWQANSNNAWTVPVGGGVGKVVSVYGQMLNIAAQGYVYPVHPTTGSGWTVQTTLQWLFPK